jgi:hypothetical protein
MARGIDIDVNAPVQMDYFALEGGYDTMTPPLIMPPGKAIQSQNFEVSETGGYRRIAGYERYDGQPAPSAQFFYTVPATITGAWAVDDTLTGATSGATSTILGSTTAGFLVAKIVGTYVASENLRIGATTVAVCTAAAYSGGAASVEDEATYTAAAADVYRADILAVPGSGQVRGVWLFGGNVYAFRNNAGGTACAMYKSSASGWTAVALGYQLAYDGGTGLISTGDTVTGATSGATGVATRVVNRTGAWGTDAQGLITFASITGTFTDNEHLRINGGGTKQALANGVNSAITLAKDGRYQFVNYNFGGTGGTSRMYGCDGINKAFEFDGTVFAPIATGMTADTPTFIAAHRSHLFLAFGSSVQHSSITNPYAWTAVLGAGELAAGEQVTGMVPHVGNDQSAALVIMTRNRIQVLYGNSSADWKLVNNEADVGGYAYTQQKIGDMYWLDDRGLTSLQAAFQFGNFQSNTVTQQIQDWLREKASRAQDSCIVRSKNQYRIFFNDKYALYLTFINNKVSGVMPILFEDEVVCSVSGEGTTGEEQMYFGSTDGVVYQMDKGTSFDGTAITAFFTTAYNHIKSPQIRKRYRKALLELRGTGYLALQFGYELDYGQTATTQPEDVTLQSNLGATYWDSFTWDDFFWDGKTLAPSDLSITGSGENIALAVLSETAISPVFTISGMLVHYTPRRRVR